MNYVGSQFVEVERCREDTGPFMKSLLPVEIGEEVPVEEVSETSGPRRVHPTIGRNQMDH